MVYRTLDQRLDDLDRFRPLQREQRQLIAQIRHKKLAGWDKSRKVFENLFAIHSVELQQQLLARIVNTTERQQLSLQSRKRRQHTRPGFESFDVIADKAI